VDSGEAFKIATASGRCYKYGSRLLTGLHSERKPMARWVHRYLHQGSAGRCSLQSSARDLVDAASGQHLSLFIHMDASAAEVR
jgi:hypothetical protein